MPPMIRCMAKSVQQNGVYVIGMKYISCIHAYTQYICMCVCVCVSMYGLVM